ncbi:unnamed protein product [Symbiodinium necroappetens]|uniref:Uncharacterized protein n=1 Tax=Symbiodinium necroappetens TaxID=1628268 RepID=A0A812XG17_9DINO|nr:unnamed protein product [Symbiodinium necroappetens]
MASEAAKPESRLRSSRTQLPRRASSPPAPMGPTAAKAEADPPASRRAVRSSGLHSATAASQAREAALRQAFPARNQSPRRRELSPQPKPRIPVQTRSARLASSGRAEAQAPARQQGAPPPADKNKQAVQALRRLVDLKEVICQEDRAKSPQLPGSSVLVHSIASEELFPPVMLDDLAGQAAEAASTACSPSLYSAGAAGGGGGGSSTTDERMRQLVLENQALREAFGDTQKRLMELEDERQCFLDEGVYDVVNSICGQTGLSPKAGLTGLMGDADNHTTKTNGDAGAITFHIGSVDPSADLLALAGSPVAPPPSADLLALAGSPAALPLSPLSLAQMVARRSEQDLRSAELSGENDKLRRELERTTKILEVLEQQRHLAEDKMLALEQEHAVLVRRLAEMEGGARSELSPDSFEVGTVKPSSLFYVM